MHLFNHDPVARFLYNGVSTPLKLGEQRRFAAARAARDHHEPIHTNLLRCHCVAPCMSYGSGVPSLPERAENTRSLKFESCGTSISAAAMRIEPPGRDDTASMPDFADVRKGEGVLAVFGIA
jgi:hypothetical protein